MSWTTRGARATGSSYVENCSPSCADPSRHAVYPSSVVLSSPTRCRRGAPLAYFARAILTIVYPRRNIFGFRRGPHTTIVRAESRDTACRRG